MTDITLGEETLTTFRQALERVSAIAHARLPQELHGNLERATALVIHQHVWMDEGGKHAQVLSSDGTTWYLVNGNCTCMGVAHAPQALCKHRLAVAIYRRASELLSAQYTMTITRGHGTADPATSRLPEAPASVNCHIEIAGRQVQVTLRDTDEARLLERLTAILERYPKTTGSVPTDSSTPEATPTCKYHGALKQSTKAPGTFFCSKKLADGSYCPSRFPER